MFYKTLEGFKTDNGYEIDGAWYPRVTSILSIKAKPGLYAYYASMPSFRAGQAATARSAQEGTAVHDTIEAILKKEEVPISHAIRPAIDAFLEFNRNNDVKPLKIEELTISKKHGYAGTIDVLAEVNGAVGVLDIKTSMATYRDYGMQTAAYVEALMEDADTPPLTRWILRIDQAQKCKKCGASLRRKGGNVKVRGGVFRCSHEWLEVQGEYELTELKSFEDDIKAFLSAKSLWEWEHKEFLDQIKAAN
jgi:hypothetical protein